MEKRTKSGWMTWVFKLSIPLWLLLLLGGCDLTLGPKVETRYVVVKAGLPAEVLENKTVRCRLLKDDGGSAIAQDIGGWIAMPPEHWETLKKELNRLRMKCGEEKFTQEK